MPENPIPLKISARTRLRVREVALQLGLTQDQLMSTLVEWFSRQQSDTQFRILASDRSGGSDLEQVLTEWLN